MKITLKRINDGVLFEAENSRGHRIRVEGAPAHGGTDSAPAPTEYLLVSQMGCTAVDVVEMLRKMRQPLAHLEMEAEAHRDPDRVPRIITHIHLHYRIFGDVKPDKAARAIDMSVHKYCTVSKMIDRVARITTTFEIFPAAAARRGEENGH